MKRMIKVLMVAVLMAVILWPASLPRWPPAPRAACYCRRPNPATRSRTPRMHPEGVWSSTHPVGPRGAGFCCRQVPQITRRYRSTRGVSYSECSIRSGAGRKLSGRLIRLPVSCGAFPERRLQRLRTPWNAPPPTPRTKLLRLTERGRLLGTALVGSGLWALADSPSLRAGSPPPRTALTPGWPLPLLLRSMPALPGSQKRLAYHPVPAQYQALLV